AMGPWLQYGDSQSHAARLSLEKDLLDELISGLPEHDLFRQNFHHSLSNWLPFYWRGFRQTTRYTYAIEDLSDLEEGWKGFKKRTRNVVGKAQKELQVRSDLPFERFWELNALTFQRQNRRLPYSRDFAEALERACQEAQSRVMLFAEDAMQRVHAAVYVVWDANSAYYLMGGADPALRMSGATSLLLWEAIQYSAKVTKRFDFEGSMIKPIESFFSGFGARQIPYFNITRMNLRTKLLFSLRDLVKSD
ncbi:MAG: GNAT family N-acetyltransferase, partial [bacterium]